MFFNQVFCYLLQVFSVAPQCPTQNSRILREDIVCLIKFWQSLHADKKYLTRECFETSGRRFFVLLCFVFFWKQIFFRNGFAFNVPSSKFRAFKFIKRLAAVSKSILTDMAPNRYSEMGEYRNSYCATKGASS